MQNNIGDLFSVLSNPRHKVIFLLLLRSEGMVSSQEMADELDVTPRTIKNDIKTMRMEMTGFGIQILSKRSEGYRLILRDQEQSDQIKDYFQIYQPNTVNDEQKLRVQYIIRRLLSSQEPIKTEQLQRELYLNESNSLYKELAEVKAFLQEYHIDLVIKPYYGITIQGELFYKISCIVRMYRYFHKYSSSDLGVAEFNDFFLCSKSEKESMRNILHRTLAGSKVVFSDLYSERFLIYLIFFRNYLLKHESIEIHFPEIHFDYKVTEEYKVIEELIQKLRNLYSGFEFDKDIIKYLTLVAVMSTDLYRFWECSEERYGELVKIAEDFRNFILNELSTYFCVNMFNDYTSFKDLLKIMIPISLKQVLKLSDDVDMGFYDIKSMDRKPVLNDTIRCLCKAFEKKYSYMFSRREQYLLFVIIQGLINRITLSHYKLKLAIIAIDGRLSTQQLKFNLQYHFGEFIEKIETKMLYELESMDSLDYDYYLCMEYGKHMNIKYSPIYYASTDLSEKEYETSLNNVFINSYGYQEFLPTLSYTKIDEKFRFEPFQLAGPDNSSYNEITTGHNHDIRLFLNLDSDREQFHIYYFTDAESMTLHGERYFIVVDTKIADNSQKLKMLMNVFDRIVDTPALLRQQCKEEVTGYHAFFTMNKINGA